MKEKNLFQLDELGNRLYTRIFQSPNGINLSANIHLKMVGSDIIKPIATYFFSDRRMVFNDRKKEKLINDFYIPIEYCVFKYSSFDIDSVWLEYNKVWYDIPYLNFEIETIFSNGKKDNFETICYFPLKGLKNPNRKLNLY